MNAAQPELSFPSEPISGVTAATVVRGEYLVPEAAIDAALGVLSANFPPIPDPKCDCCKSDQRLVVELALAAAARHMTPAERSP